MRVDRLLYCGLYCACYVVKKRLKMSGALGSEHLSEEDEWVMAITTDNAMKTDDILKNSPNCSTKSILLHTPLSVRSPLDKAHQKYTHRINLLPLHLAVICHARDVVECFVQHGVNVTQRDDRGNNVLHTLIIASSHLQCNDRVNSVAMYHRLTKLFSERIVEFCLHQEDAKGLRPLELAASLGHFHLVNTIFHTPSVYLCKTEICGFQLLQYFRVTEYERFRPSYLINRPVRDHVSPMRLLCQLHQCSIDMIQAKSSLLCEPLSTWELGKFHLNKWFMILQVVVGLLELVLFFHLTRPQRLNATSNSSADICASIPKQNHLAWTSVICLSIMSTIVNIYGMFNAKPFTQIPRNLTCRNISSSGYRMVVDLCSSVTLLTFCLLSLWLTHDTQVATVVFHVLYLGIMLCVVRRLIRWCLVVECLRKYAMTLDTINSSFGHIFQTVILFFLVHGTLLQHLRVLDSSHNFLEIPFSYLYSLYETFLLLLNIETVENVQTNHTVMWKEFHMLGHFSIVVLLFNFLIASMVTTYRYICTNFGVYSFMYRLDTAFRSQDCIPPIITRLYIKYVHKAFVVENGEVYVVCLTTINTSYYKTGREYHRE